MNDRERRVQKAQEEKQEKTGFLVVPEMLVPLVFLELMGLRAQLVLWVQWVLKVRVGSKVQQARRVPWALKVTVDTTAQRAKRAQ